MSLPTTGDRAGIRPDAPSGDLRNEAPWPSPRYQSSRTRALWVQELLATTGGLAVIGGFFSFEGATWLYDFLNRTYITHDWESWASAFDGVSGATGVATIGALVALLLWLHRTVRNAPALGAGTPPTSPGWAVGWWFVPVANLWQPYAILRDLWGRMVGPGHKHAWIVGAWWASWVVAVVSLRVVGAGIASTTNEESLQSLLYWAGAAYALAALAAFAGVLMVREMQRGADSKALALRFDPATPSHPTAVIAVPAPAVADAGPTLSPGVPEVPSIAARPVAFCHQCGQRKVPGDRFCAVCGAELRS